MIPRGKHAITLRGRYLEGKEALRKVSDNCLPLYSADFQFRSNNRNKAGIFGKAMAEC